MVIRPSWPPAASTHQMSKWKIFFFFFCLGVCFVLMHIFLLIYPWYSYICANVSTKLFGFSIILTCSLNGYGAVRCGAGGLKLYEIWFTLCGQTCFILLLPKNFEAFSSKSNTTKMTKNYANNDCWCPVSFVCQTVCGGNLATPFFFTEKLSSGSRTAGQKKKWVFHTDKAPSEHSQLDAQFINNRQYSFSSFWIYVSMKEGKRCAF